MHSSARNRLVFSAFCLCSVAAAACSSAHGEGFDSTSDEPDAAQHVWPSGKTDAGNSDDASVHARDAASDAALEADGAISVVGPTADECLDGWASYDGGCPAPTITDSYVGNGCEGTTGWFIDGANFQLRQHNTGIADYGPQSFGANGNQMNWNEITTTQLCVTVAASASSAWVGHTIYVTNPDGKSSNSVTVTSKL